MLLDALRLNVNQGRSLVREIHRGRPYIADYQCTGRPSTAFPGEMKETWLVGRESSERKDPRLSSADISSAPNASLPIVFAQFVAAAILEKETVGWFHYTIGSF